MCIRDSPYPPHPCRLTLVNVDTEHNVVMSTTRRKQKEGFDPQSMQEQQAVNRVTREHCSSLFHFTAVLPSALLPIPTVTPWDVTPSLWYYRECGPHYRVFPTVTLVPLWDVLLTSDIIYYVTCQKYIPHPCKEAVQNFSSKTWQ